MGRLIDADRLKAHYCWWAGGSKEMSIDEAKKTFDTIIDVQPTVDIDAITTSHEQIGFDKGYREGYAQATVDAERHGHWETEVRTDRLGLKHCNYACSACGRAQDDETPFCALCGAKMDSLCSNCQEFDCYGCEAKMDEVEDG